MRAATEGKQTRASPTITKLITHLEMSNLADGKSESTISLPCPHKGHHFKLGLPGFFFITQAIICQKGEKHTCLVLTRSLNGRPEQLHIPKDKEEMVREWVENYHQVQELIENISSSYWDRLKRKG